LLLCFFFLYLQGLPIQQRRPLNPRAVRTDLGNRVWTQHVGLQARRSRLQTLPRRFAQGCRPARPGVTARRVGFLEAPKARQTLRQVSACHGLGQSQHHVVVAWGVWPVQCPGLTPSYQVSAASGGVPPARLLYPQPHHTPTKQCSPQWKFSQFIVTPATV